MKTTSERVFAALGAISLALAATAVDGAPNPHTAALRQIQVKIEWVKTAPTSSTSLTVAATEDQTGTVSLVPDASSPEGASVTIRPHIRPDGSITVLLAVSRTGAQGGRQFVSTVRTFKPGERLPLSGLVSGVGSERVFATTSLVKASDDPFAAPSGLGVPKPTTPH